MPRILTLSPIDHVFTGIGSYPVEFAFSYKGNIDEKRLQDSLEETCRYFPPVAGTLIRTEDGSYAFDTDKQSIRFEVVTGDVPYEETGDRASFIDPVRTEVGEPMARIRLTRTRKGVVLGVSISHSVGDGFSYFYFLSSWSKIFHAQSIVPPSHDRQLLSVANARREATVDRDEVLDRTGLFLAEKRHSIPRAELVWETIRLGKDALGDMLGELVGKSEVRFSHNDAIVTMLCRKYIPQWNAGGAAEAFVSCPVDFRRLVEGFPTNYFGNAVALATTRIRGDQLLPVAMPQLATEIRKRIASVDGSYIKGSMEVLDRLRTSQGLQAFEHLHVAHPQSGLLVTNLSRLPVREIQFDAGPPVGYEILTPAQRGAVVLPGKDGVEIRVCRPVDL